MNTSVTSQWRVMSIIWPNIMFETANSQLFCTLNWENRPAGSWGMAKSVFLFLNIFGVPMCVKGLILVSGGSSPPAYLHSQPPRSIPNYPCTRLEIRLCRLPPHTYPSLLHFGAGLISAPGSSSIAGLYPKPPFCAGQSQSGTPSSRSCDWSPSQPPFCTSWYHS